MGNRESICGYGSSESEAFDSLVSHLKYEYSEDVYKEKEGVNVFIFIGKEKSYVKMTSKVVDEKKYYCAYVLY